MRSYECVLYALVAVSAFGFNGIIAHAVLSILVGSYLVCSCASICASPVV